MVRGISSMNQNWTATDIVPFPLGVVCKLHMKETPHNTEAPRNLDCIHPRGKSSVHGGHELCHIPTNEVITRHGNVTVVPTPKHAIDSLQQ